MNKRMLSFFLCMILLLNASGCKKKAPDYEREDSGGTGFGVIQKSAILEQDLYFFSVSTTRSEVLTALGSPQSYMISDGNTYTYRLQDGATLALTYNEREVVKTAVYTTAAGEKNDLFEYLVSIGILKSSTSQNGNAGNTGVGNQTNPQGSEQGGASSGVQSGQTEEGGYFASKRYSYSLAEQILKVGVSRETVVSALGKPNSYSSVSFKKDSYLIDVYTMDDGSNLYLDYGYARENLRAVRMVKGSEASVYLGSWGEEEKPKGFYRETKNLNLFNTLKKNAKPSEIYQQYGAPDWFEGTEGNYRDAYQLLDAAVLYLNFGAGHGSLASASLQKADGTVSAYSLR